MLDPLFSEAWCHAAGGHTVLGRRLHPLCALDLLALEAVNSPFLVDNESVKVEVADLLLAIWILSNDHPKDCTIANLELNDDGQKWMKAIAGTIDMERDCPVIVSHFKDYWSLPEMMRTIAENPLTPTGSPWMLSRVIMVCRTLHVPLYEAWTMGIGQLIWYCCSIEEQDNSDSRIVGPSMREQLELAKDAYKIHTPAEGESEEAFAKRLGLTVEQLREMRPPAAPKAS